MAVNLTTVSSSAVKKIVDVEATSDADTTATIPHGMASAPKEYQVTMLATAATLSLWRVTTVDATNVVLTKSTTGSSGASGAQIRVTIALPHSIVA
jgi:hypothetical protein